MKSRTLADRSGRAYPHNAIYEILTYRNPDGAWREPKKYSKKTLNEFTKMLNAASDLTRMAYTLVYQNGNTLTEAGKIMRMSPTTVRKYLNDIFFARDEYGYLVANLEKTVRGSFKDIPTSDGMNVHQHIKWYLTYHCKDKHDLSDAVLSAILEYDYDGCSPIEIGSLLRVKATIVKKVIAEYAPFKKGRLTK